MTEIALEGRQAINLVSSEDFPSDNVFGAILYDPDEDIEYAVKKFSEERIEVEGAAFPITWLLARERQLIFTSVTPALRELIHSSISPVDLKKAQVSEALRRLAFPIGNPMFSEQDKELCLTVLSDPEIPSQRARIDFFEIVKKADELRFATKFFSDWLEKLEIGKAPDAYGRVHLAYLYRHTGQYQKAIKVTNVVEFPRSRFPCSPAQIAILATIRAATFLDIY